MSSSSSSSSSSSPRYFHGVISRAEAEDRINACRSRYPSQNLYLIRKSKDSGESVLSCSPALREGASSPMFTHLIVRTTPQSALYLEIPYNSSPPQFPTLDKLIEYYKDPAAGSPAPIGVFVPNQEQVQVPSTMRASDYKSDTLRSKSTLSSSSSTSVSNNELHPNFVPLPRQEGMVKQDTPDTGLRFAPGGGIFLEAKPDEHKEEHLLCEGYLDKKRGTGRTKTRWFRLSTKRFAYFTEDAGEIIGCVNVSEIAAVIDLSKTEFRIVTKTPFGSGNRMEVVLEAPSKNVKNKWLAALKNEDNMDGGFRRYEGRLFVEGLLEKVKPFGQSNMKRWFMLTNLHFSYYKEEAGELKGSVPLENIVAVGVMDSRTFKVMANVRFTVSGAFEVECRCDTESVRNKWLIQMQRLIDRDKFQT